MSSAIASTPEATPTPTLTPLPIDYEYDLDTEAEKITLPDHGAVLPDVDVPGAIEAVKQHYRVALDAMRTGNAEGIAASSDAECIQCKRVIALTNIHRAQGLVLSSEATTTLSNIHGGPPGEGRPSHSVIGEVSNAGWVFHDTNGNEHFQEDATSFLVQAYLVPTETGWAIQEIDYIDQERFNDTAVWMAVLNDQLD